MTKHCSSSKSKSETSLLSGYEPASTPSPVHSSFTKETAVQTSSSSSPASTSSKRRSCHSHRKATDMARQDSGYESTTTRAPLLHQRSSPRAQRSSASTRGSVRGCHSRPAARRASKSGPVVRAPTTAYNSSKPLVLTQTTPFSANTPAYGTALHGQANSYFTFPVPALPQHESADLAAVGSPHCEEASSNAVIPPQTTYWMSDHTRRQEYADIDAFSHGFKGWVIRNLVPDCFIPKSARRTTFDDDSGSVRRYRLDLESEESEKMGCHKKKRRFGTF